MHGAALMTLSEQPGFSKSGWCLHTPRWGHCDRAVLPLSWMFQVCPLPSLRQSVSSDGSARRSTVRPAACLDRGAAVVNGTPLVRGWGRVGVGVRVGVRVRVEHVRRRARPCEVSRARAERGAAVRHPVLDARCDGHARTLQPAHLARVRFRARVRWPSSR